MKISNPTAKYRYVVDLLRTADEEFYIIVNRLFSESKENTRSFKSILAQKMNDKPEIV